MAKVELDDEVVAALGKKQEGFGETPNDVLRRMLNLDMPKAPEAGRTKSITRLIEANLLGVGEQLTWARPMVGQKHHATVLAGGLLELSNGRTASSPSGACKSIAGTAIAGWDAWKTDDNHSLNDVWDAYLAQQEEGAKEK